MKITNLNTYRTQLFGVAITLVILYHMWCQARIDAVSLFRYGYIGVDIFIFLSGLGCSYAYNKYPIMVFYKRRFTRIIPIHIIFVCLCGILATLLFGHPWTILQWIEKITTIEFFRSNLESTNWFIPSILMLYLFFPVMFKLASRFRYAVPIVFLITGFALVIWPNFTWYHSCFISRLGIFLLGIKCYLHNKSGKDLMWKELIMYGIGGILFSPLFINKLFFFTALCCPFFLFMVVIPFIKYIDDKVKIVNSFFTFMGEYSLEFFLGNCIAAGFYFHYAVVGSPMFLHQMIYIINTILFAFFFIFANKYLQYAISYVLKKSIHKL